MKKARQLLAAGLLLVFGISSAHAELVSKYGGIYDTKANIIWSQDANLLGTLEGTTAASYNALVSAVIAANRGAVFDIPNYVDDGKPFHVLSAADFGTGGTASHWGAIAFVNYLNVIRYGGSNQWTLPFVPNDASSLGYEKTDNPFGELFYTELGGVAGHAIPASPFLNVQDMYWFANDTYALNSNYAWLFSKNWGYQLFTHKDYLLFVWPVRPGPGPAIGWR
jgi:hypothetical protein